MKMTPLPAQDFASWRRTTLHFSTGQVLLLMIWAVTRVANGGVELTPQRVEEGRTKIFNDDKVSRTPASLKVTFELTGPEAESARDYGHLKLEEAIDDAGSSLIQTNDPFHNATKFREYSNAFFRKSNFPGNSRTAKPQVELELAVPKRAATKIARLRGSLELADAGTSQTFEVTGLKTAGKKQLPIPAATQLTVTALPSSTGNSSSLKLEITGDESALSSLEVEDASGHKISSGGSSWSMNGGPIQKSLVLEKPLDDSMKLVAKVISDRKITKVPFDLKDIALP